MKQMIFIFTFYTLSLSHCFAQVHAQNDASSQSNPNAFRVIDLKINSTDYLIVTCRDDFGRTIQFLTGSSQITRINKHEADALALGVTVITDFTTGTVSIPNYPTLKYAILKPFFLHLCCSISKIEFAANNQAADFVIVKEDTANGLTYFNKNSSPGVILKIKQPVYQKIFNNKRYAILKPIDERELNENIFYSYELKFMTHEVYNSIRKNVPGNNVIANNKEPVDSLPLTDPGKIEISNMPGGNITTGMIHVDVPAGVECMINIYSRYNNRLYSSGQQRKFLLFPQMYNIEISGVLLKNIPISKGIDTRVKTGTLSVTSGPGWTLYDENNIKKIYSSPGPGKVEFPIGVYQLEISGSLNKIEIQDRKTLEFKDIARPPETQKLNTDTNHVINKKPVPDLISKEKTDSSTTPANTDPVASLPSINPGNTEISEIMFGKNMVTGMLHINAPADVECTINIYSVPDHTLLFNSGQQRSFSLLPGTYDIEVSGMTIKNIPVNKGMDTRIKAGVLSITTNGPWTLYDKNKVKAIYISSQAKSVEFPAGIYQLEINGSLHPVEIKDGEKLDNNIAKVPVQTEKINMVDSTKNIIAKPGVTNSLAGDKKWEIKPNPFVKGNNGRIILSIPKETESIINITQPVTEKEVYYSGILTKERSFFLPPGNYNVEVSGNTVKNVPVQKGMDTRIKTGMLEVTASGIWTLYDEKKDKQVYFSAEAKKIGLPAGIYQLEINGTVNQVTIKDGETVKF